MKILHIEPGRSIAQLVAISLQDIDCQLTQVSNFTDAISQLKTQSFDVICSSNAPDGRDSTAFCAKLRERQELKYVPFLLYATDLKKELLIKCAECGVTELINKSELSEKLAGYIKRYQKVHSKIDGRVLVVEDSQSQKQYLDSLIRETGLTVEACSNVEEACYLLTQNHYHLIITDVFLSSEYTALELVSQVKNLPPPNNMAFIIAISSFDNASRRLELLNRGVDVFMAKPIDGKELQTIARSFVEKSLSLSQFYATQSPDTVVAPAIRSGIDSPHQKQCSVLYIEDNKVLQILMKNFVSSIDNVTISLATTGEEGMQQILQHSPDILLLDLNLPDTDGWSLAEKIRQTDTGHTLKIIAVTGEIMNQEKKQNAETLFDGFIAKPFNKERIDNVIAQQRTILAQAALASGE
jgi:CheY-like chemotaxis protein